MTIWLIFITSMFGAPAVDDGPCPAGTTAVVLAGSDYEHDLWTIDGVPWGWSVEEDDCIVVLP
jgi:hypothetical protein